MAVSSEQLNELCRGLLTDLHDAIESAREWTTPALMGNDFDVRLALTNDLMSRARKVIDAAFDTFEVGTGAPDPRWKDRVESGEVRG